jgi:hypothetical protein
MSEFVPTHAAEQPPAEVADVRAELDGLADLDLADHPDVYQRIHAELQSALAAVDDA